MRTLRMLTLAVSLAALLAACGGNDNAGAPKAGGPGTGAGSPGSTINNQGTGELSSDGKLTLEMDDRYFKPTFIKAMPGQTVNLGLENEGELPHNFTLTAANQDETVQPGGKKEITFTLPQTGDVAFFCKFHAEQGMRGAFFFGSAPSSSTGSPASSGGGGSPY